MATLNTPAANRIRANIFHPFSIQHATTTWTAEVQSLEALLNTNAHDGVGEKAILDWFSESTARIGMLVFGLHRIVPTHVARELVIGRFRSDFAWASTDPGTEPTVGLIELEEDKRYTLFDSRGRTTPRIGDKFLAGFSQLTDWCSFGQADVAADPSISAAIGAYTGQVNYYFSMIAGQNRFFPDPLSRRRLAWWDENIRLGHGTKFMTFDQLIDAVRRALLLRNSL